MPKLPCSPLTVATDGARSFINVPSDLATDLHHFLRSHRITTSPPEPLWSGTDCIQLAKGANGPGIQQLLDGWVSEPAPAIKVAKRSPRAARPAAGKLRL